MSEQELIDTVMTTLDAMLTPPLIGAVVLTLAATHLAKVIGEYWLPVTSSEKRWRAFCASVSAGLGLVAGIGAWLGTDAPWYVVPAVAFGSGPAWRIAQGIIPARFARLLLTETDCRYRKRQKGSK